MKDKILEAKKKNKIYRHLFNYYFNKIEDNKELGKECDSYIKCFDDLYKKQRITLKEFDIITDNMVLLMQFVIYVISHCPELLIVLQNNEKEGV